MYEAFFGLREKPFALTPNTEFLVQLAPYQGCLNLLRLALAEGEGFIKVIGEVGTGKTLLCRRLLQTLGDGVATAYLPNPNLEPQTLLLALAEELRVTDASGLDQYHLLRRINHALLDYARAGKRVVLCIDEAQAMPLDTLEALRLVSNLETEKRKLIQIALFGQPELDEKLSDPSVRQLLQRITFHQRLVGLGKEEIALYLQHRMRVAGYRGEPLFTSGALRALRRATRGTPRLINVLAHKSLLSAFGEGRQVVKFSHVKGAARDTEGARSPGWW